MTTDAEQTGVRIEQMRSYQRGFSNEFATEALEGALPDKHNSPQKPPFGLVSELVSGSAFAAPLAANRRSYLFRIRPSTIAGKFEAIAQPNFLTPPLQIDPVTAAIRWGPPDIQAEADFLDSIVTLCGNGSPKQQSGSAIHFYRAGRTMQDRVFANLDAEMMILPQTGLIHAVTELGILDVVPGELLIIPKGMKHRIEVGDAGSRGIVCENFGRAFILPERGLIGSHGLANAIDFEVPYATFEDVESPIELVQKFCGQFYRTQIGHSPFDVVAWRGTWVPMKYDMSRFCPMGAVSHDHPDPSIYCALTSPSDAVIGGNLDFMVLPPRWLVAEGTFRPPGYHRNSVAEVLGIISGASESRNSNFPPGAVSLHNPWTAHGPDVTTLEAGRKASQEPMKIEDSLIFMFESRYPFELSAAACDADFRLHHSTAGWDGFQKRFPEYD